MRTIRKRTWYWIVEDDYPFPDGYATVFVYHQVSARFRSYSVNVHYVDLGKEL